MILSCGTPDKSSSNDSYRMKCRCKICSLGFIMFRFTISWLTPSSPPVSVVTWGCGWPQRECGTSLLRCDRASPGGWHCPLLWTSSALCSPSPPEHWPPLEEPNVDYSFTVHTFLITVIVLKLCKSPVSYSHSLRVLSWQPSCNTIKI